MLLKFVLSQTSLPCTIFTLTSLSLLFGVSEDNSYPELFSKEPKDYDFIVIGAGTAGSVIANRLTENGNWNVLLLEAGKEEPLLTAIPAFTELFTGTPYDWKYQSRPENNACNLRGFVPLRAGKVMGGTTSINYMLYVRGNREDYNNWERMGNTGWSYNDVLPYFMKSEDNRDQDILQGGSMYHGTGGYLTVERFQHVDPRTNIILRAYQEFGLRQTDINGENQIGSMLAQSTSRNGSRMSTNRAFLRPIRRRNNLFIKNQVYVTKILIEPITKIAYGVQYTSTITGDTKIALAKKEIIISAGSIESPKLLMLSGIGPINELFLHAIPLLKNLSVGHNLHDHMGALGLIGSTGEDFSFLPSCERNMNNLNDFYDQHRGPLASVGPISATGFFQTNQENRTGVPDIQLFTGGFSPILPYYNMFGIIPAILAPKTRGFVRLNKLNPILGNPEINHKCLADADVDTLREATYMAIRIFNTTVFRENNFTLINKPLPGCHMHEYNTDDYWNCVIRKFTFLINEQVGTCKMGPREDSEAVVDPRLRVHGIKNLRVADASIIPVIPRGSTMAPVIMIGEKASDMIKQDWS